MKKATFACVLVTLLWIAAGSPGSRGAIGAGVGTGLSVVGTRVSGDVTFLKENLEAIRAGAPPGPDGIGTPRVVPFLKVPPRVGTDAPSFPGLGTSAASAPLFAPTSPSAPALAGNFPGMNGIGANVIPPDTMGAAGPSHVVEILNSGLGIFNKATGLKLSEVSLGTFWGATLVGVRHPFDPKVVFDPGGGRFIAVSLLGSGSSNSVLLVAATETGDPTGVWNKYGIPANTENSSNWADYPCIGFDDTNIYVSANMFTVASDAFQYSKVWVIPKAPLYSGSPSITRTEFANPPGNNAVMQPAVVYGASPVEYFVHEGYTLGGVPPRRQVRLSRIGFPGGAPTWTDLGFIDVASYPLDAPGTPPAPQLNATGRIDTNDTRLINAVLHNGRLWTTHHVSNDADTKTEVAWYEFDPVAMTVVQQGRVSDPARFYFYPAIAVNASGDAALGFSGSSPTEFAGAFYTGRASSDPPGSMQLPVGTLKAGEAVFDDTLNGQSPTIRWGDFSATTVDPSDGNTFWTIQEYAAAPDNTWATWWGRFTLSAPTAPNTPAGLTATAVFGQQIDLAWTDNSVNETGFKIERSATPGVGFVQVGTAVANATTFSDSGLTVGSTFFYRVRATNGAGDSAPSNESGATTPLSPSAPVGLTATTVSASRINLAWTVSSTNQTGFTIERSTFPGIGFVQAGTAPDNATTFGDSGLAAGTTYFYRVRATNGAGSSVPSNEASATTLAGPAAPPASGGGGGGCSAAGGASVDSGAPAGFLIAILSSGAILGLRRRRTTRPGSQRQ